MSRRMPKPSRRTTFRRLTAMFEFEDGGANGATENAGITGDPSRTNTPVRFSDLNWLTRLKALIAP